MTDLVVLERSEGAVAEGYDIRLGPLAFVTPADAVGETLGDGLEVVGAALVAAERRPRPLRLKLPVRGYELDVDPKESGLRLRRQVRSFIENAKLRLQGAYFTWEADPDLDGWLLIGGAELTETDPGISFGEFEMELSDVYIVGRPGTHKPGRRASIVDLRDGLAPRDSRRILYSTDFEAQALPEEPLYLPGDSASLVRSGNKPVAKTTLGPERAGARHLWRSVEATDAEILSYVPDQVLLPGRDSYIDLDELGSVRLWNLDNATVYPPDPVEYTEERDLEPDIYWHWERIHGAALTANPKLAMDNGAVRLIWLGSASSEGLAIEYWDSGLGHYRRIGRVMHAASVREQHIVEANGERAVIEWRAGRYGMRAILQRGWWGPRLESYDDGGETARLEYQPEGTGALSVTEKAPTWVWEIKRAVGSYALLWASGSVGESRNTEPTVISGTTAACVWRTRVLIAQLGCPPGPTATQLASQSLVDARAIPVLIGHG